MTYKHKQAGGTILGLIIGLIIGLSIAVGVAVTITKTPVPFIDRGFKTDRGGNAAGGEMPDLNKSLYGNREPARQAAKEFRKDPVVVAEPAAESSQPQVQATALQPTTPPVAMKASIDSKEAAKPAAEEAKWTYYLQAGAFREQTDAENTKAKLALLGIETRISERTGDNGTLYRVRVGPFAQVDAMNKVRSKLSENGVDVAVVRIPG